MCRHGEGHHELNGKKWCIVCCHSVLRNSWARHKSRHLKRKNYVAFLDEEKNMEEEQSMNIVDEIEMEGIPLDTTPSLPNKNV